MSSQKRSNSGLFLTIQQTANLLGVTYWSIRQRLSAGQLEHVYDGRTTLIPRAAVERLSSDLHEQAEVNRQRVAERRRRFQRPRRAG